MPVFWTQRQVDDVYEMPIQEQRLCAVCHRQVVFPFVSRSDVADGVYKFSCFNPDCLPAFERIYRLCPSPPIFEALDMEQLKRLAGDVAEPGPICFTGEGGFFFESCWRSWWRRLFS